jgi:exodeoxyribonuclease VII small subunit
MKFEESVSRLDEIIAIIENGETTLEQSLLLYDEGAKLIAGCREELSNAEFVVTVKDASGGEV